MTDNTNGHHNLSGGDIDPDAGKVKLSVTYDPLTKQCQFTANTQDHVMMYGMLEMAKTIIIEVRAQSGKEPRIAVPIFGR